MGQESLYPAHDVKRAMSGILLAMSNFTGLYVLRKAHNIEAPEMKINSLCGNEKGAGIPMNIERCNEMAQPRNVPMMTPVKELESTRMNAS